VTGRWLLCVFVSIDNILTTISPPDIPLADTTPRK